MKKYNEKLLQASKEILQESLCKSRETVKKLTNPSNEIERIGSRIGMGIGVGLTILGTTQFILGYSLWGSSSFFTGAATIISNVINIKKKRL